MAAVSPEQLADWCSCGHQLVVGALQGHELVVRSLLYHVAPRHDGDDVGVLDGGQAVGDHDAGPALSGFVQGLLHRLSQSIKKKKNTQRRKTASVHLQREPQKEEKPTAETTFI